MWRCEGFINNDYYYSVVVYYIFGEFVEYFFNKTTFCLLSAYTPWQKQSNRPVFCYNVRSIGYNVLLWDVCGWLCGLISWKLTNVIANEWGILHVSAYTHTHTTLMLLGLFLLKQWMLSLVSPGEVRGLWVGIWTV